MSRPERGLGRGLDALFRTMPQADAVGEMENWRSLPLASSVPNKSQPRKQFAEEALQELADSIRQDGLLQPLLVRPLNGGTYEIVAGERRWRAAGMAGLEQVPAIIRQLNDEQSLALALIENLQREDLNPMEEALGYQELRDNFKLSQNEIAERVGKSRSAVANTLRLLQLPTVLQDDIIADKMTQGHARPLVGLEDEQALAAIREAILTKEPSVREVEQWVAAWRESGALPDAPAEVSEPKSLGRSRRQRETDPDFPALESKLREFLGVRVSLKGTLEQGVLKLSFSSKEELAKLLQNIGLNL